MRLTASASLFKRTLVNGLGCLIFGSIFLGLGSVAMADSENLEVAKVSLRSLPRQHVFDGVVEAVHQATVSSQTSGRIVAVNFDVDDFVPKNSVLVRFHDTEQQARVNASLADLKEARAKATVAQQEYQRTQDVYQKKLVAKSVLDRAKSEFKAASARLKAADARLIEAQEQLEKTRVRAPYSGIVVQRHIEVGETAQIGQPLFTGLSLERLRLNVLIPQSWFKAIRQSTEAAIVLPGGDDVPLDIGAMVVFPQADSQSHTFRIRFEIPTGIPDLHPGMFTKIRFNLGQEDRLVIPKSAVVNRSEVTAVYVVDGLDRVSFRHVRVGASFQQQIEVLAGLKEKDQVAVDPVKAVLRLKQQKKK